MGNNGWIKLHRKIRDNFLWKDKPFSKAQAWIDILLDVNHKENEILLGNEIVEVGVGEKVTSIRKLCDRWGWSNTKVRNFLKLLEKRRMIDYESDTKKTVLKVLNYSNYQRSEDKENDAKTHQKHNKNTSKTHQKHTNKNVKNDNNDNKNNSGDKFSIKKLNNGRYKYPAGYEKVYKMYPDNKGTKKAGWRRWAARRREDISNEKLIKAAKNYNKKVENEDTDKKYVKHISTFYGPDDHWREFLEYEVDEDNKNVSEAWQVM